MSQLTKWLPLAALALAVTAACAPADEDDHAAKESTEQSEDVSNGFVVVGDEAKLNLVAEVKKGSYSLKYYEPEPGVLMESESGQIGLDDKLAPDVDMLTKYRVLAGEAPPPLLVEAYERLQALKATRPAAEDDVEDPDEELDVTPANAAQEKDKTWGRTEVTREWFQSTYCVEQDRYIPKIGMTGVYRNSKDCEYFKSGIFAVSGQLDTFQGCGGGYGYVGLLDAGFYVAVRCDTVFDRVHWSEVKRVSPSDSVWDMCTNWHR